MVFPQSHSNFLLETMSTYVQNDCEVKHQDTLCIPFCQKLEERDLDTTVSDSLSVLLLFIVFVTKTTYKYF
jgi:hypothetical protein